MFKGTIGFGFSNVCEGLDPPGASLLGKTLYLVKEHSRH